MKIRSLYGASLCISGFIALLVSVGFAIAKIPIELIASFVAVIFAVLWVMIYYVLRKYIVYKLKPIYQIVLAKNISIKEMEHEFQDSKLDMIEEIKGKVEDWAEMNKREIVRLKENEQYRKDFLGDVSHEIKTPIFNVQGYILTLLDGALEDETINRKYLERAEKSIDRLINIVIDLEEISKLESGVLLLNKERFDLSTLVKDIAEATEINADKRNISIEVRVPQGMPVMVCADRRYIGQVFVNLIVNSIKYGKEGGKTRIIFIDLFDKVMVEVIDNGVGIAQDDIPRVFERFYRTDKSRSREQGGTGLGLSIVKHILDAHGESVKLRSELGVGSTFSFTLKKDRGR